MFALGLLYFGMIRCIIPHKNDSINLWGEMMDFQELVSKLKQSNISKNGDKTKARVKPLWKAASKDQREAILSLADVKDVSVRRAYVTGSISAKLTAAISKTLNVNPYYLTGQFDEAGEYSESLLVEMLEDLKYDKLLAEAGLLGGPEKKRGRRKAAPARDEEPVAESASAPVEAPAVAEPVEPVAVAVAAAAPKEPVAAETAKAEPIVDPACPSVLTIQVPAVDDVDLSEDEAVLLLKAAFLKSKAGGASAEKARQIRAMLLS